MLIVEDNMTAAYVQLNYSVAYFVMGTSREVVSNIKALLAHLEELGFIIFPTSIQNALIFVLFFLNQLEKSINKILCLAVSAHFIFFNIIIN